MLIALLLGLQLHGVVRIEEPGKPPVMRGSGVPTDTAFWVASISKSFTAALILRLRDLGKLELSDLVAGSDITLDELLTHTSGLPHATYLAEGIADPDEAARRILAQPRGPKGKFAYTNDGYALLAIAAERAGGAPFFQLLQREVLDRAGLRHTGFWPRCFPGARVARLSRPPRGARAKENWGFKGSDGICSTAQDLAAFMRAVAAGRVTAHPELLFERKVPLGDGFAGRGFFVSKNGTVWTRGTEDYGHNGVVKLLTDGTILVALSDVPALRREDVAQSRAMGDLLEQRHFAGRKPPAEDAGATRMPQR
ncbi:MAG TPA: serine hydrolase domain-containing protein [Myxococcales bacterium]|nr:serine hydrolase domain-containing protein [Myxococcales bacterium]